MLPDARVMQISIKTDVCESDSVDGYQNYFGSYCRAAEVGVLAKRVTNAVLAITLGICESRAVR